MLTELYIEALLASESRADQVWQLWVAGEIADESAAISWAWIAATSSHPVLCDARATLYSESETAWLNLRAEKIAEERGWPLPMARSEAAAELVRSRASGHSARVINISHVRTLPDPGRSRP